MTILCGSHRINRDDLIGVNCMLVSHCMLTFALTLLYCIPGFPTRSFGKLRVQCCYLNLGPDIVDIKPANMEELTEVITAAVFHPIKCNEFVYSSSKGSIREVPLYIESNE